MTAPGAERVAFTEWARQSLEPLSSAAPGVPDPGLAHLGAIVGDASVVALSEGAHGAAEPLEFRNRAFRYLVEEKGFSAIAIESGIVEGRAVHDYVRGGPGGLSTAVERGIGWTFDRFPQNRDLVRWLRAYNGKPTLSRKVNFYGFDVPGSPGNAKARRAPDTALLEVLQYLDRVDPPTAAVHHRKIDAFLPSIRIDCDHKVEGPSYPRLDQSQRDTLTAAIADLITLIERKEAPYTQASSAEDYEWAHRATIGARQMDAWLRQIPIGWQPSSEPAGDEDNRCFTAALDTRDRAQVENLEWIIRREGAFGKILIYASRFHVSASAFKVASTSHETAGTYLRRRLADRLVTIGNLIGRGESGEGEIAQAAPETIDGVAGGLGVPHFLLDLRGAPAPVAQWLAQEHSLAAGQEGARLAIGQAFDVLFYLDTVTAV